MTVTSFHSQMIFLPIQYAQANTDTKPRIMSSQSELLRRTRTLIYPPSLGLSFREAGHSGGVGERDLQQGA